MIVELCKGTIRNAIPALTAVTTTSPAQKAKGHNAIIIFAKITGTGTWSIKVQGATSGNGTFMDVTDYKGDAMAISSATASKAQVFKGLPENFKIVATEDANGATIEVDYELITL